MINLPSPWLTCLNRIFSQFAPDYEVWAYGSRVSGHHHDGSDLDLVLRHPTNQPVTNLAAIKAALSDSALPILVDVSDWANLPPAFQQAIEPHCVKLFDAIH